YSNINVAVLSIAGACDDDQAGALRHYREHLETAAPAARERHYLILGPWDHAGTRSPKQKFLGLELGTASVIDLRKLHREWYEWVIRGGDRPAFLQKRVAYYVMGAEEWRYADSLDDITRCCATLYLSSDGNALNFLQGGRLSTTVCEGGGPDLYFHDPGDISGAGKEAWIDPESRVDPGPAVRSSGKHLVYHSRPVRNRVDIVGFFRLSVWLSIDQPDTDFDASIYEVAFDGSTILLSRDFLRARYRESPRVPTPVSTTSPLHYQFSQFPFIAKRMEPGGRLRLVLGPLHPIFWQRNFNSGGCVSAETIQDARPVTVGLHYGPLFPSF